MKNKDLEKKIRSSVSPDKDRIWAKVQSQIPCDVEISGEAVTNNGNTRVSFKNRRNLIYTITALFLALAIALAVVIPLVTKRGGLKDFSGSFYIDINPSVQVSVDADGKVTDVTALNDDASVMLFKTDISTLKGKSAEEVADEIWQLAIATGYIKPSLKDNAVLITGSLTNEKLNAEFGQKIKNRLVQTIRNKGVYCAVLTDKVNNSLQSEADGYGISVSKYQLIKYAISLGVNIDVNSYATITVRELNNLIQQQGKRIEKLGDSVNAILENAEDLLDEFEDIVEDSLIKILLENVEEILDTIEDHLEDGNILSQIIFDSLTSNLTSINNNLESLEDEYSDFVARWQEAYNQLGDLKDTIDNAKSDFEQKYNEYVAEVTEYQKPDNFDDDYEDWLEEFYDYYRENWDDKKNNWHPHS